MAKHTETSIKSVMDEGRKGDKKIKTTLKTVMDESRKKDGRGTTLSDVMKGNMSRKGDKGKKTTLGKKFGW